MGILRKLIMSIYPKWINKIDEYPSQEDYISNFIKIYKHHPNKCDIRLYSGGAVIKTPDSYEIDGSYRDNVTDKPILNLSQLFFFYRSGPNWDYDYNLNTYYLIDFFTMKPHNWDEIKSKRIIYNYLKNEKMIIRNSKINILLNI
jgi:hypothetical protein